MADHQEERMARTLQQALLTLLAKYQFESITTSQIADEALIHRTTFYAHYEDKYALLDATLQSQFAAAGPINTADLYQRPFATLAQWCGGVLAPVVAKQRRDESFQKAMLKLFFGALNRSAKSPTSLANYLLVGRIKAVMHWVHETDQPYNIYTAGDVLDETMNKAETRVDTGM